MYAIETELGRFEGDTEKEAKKALRKAQRERAKQDAIESELRKVARLRAESQAYHIYDEKTRVALGHQKRTSLPPGWVLYPVTTEGYCVREGYDTNRHERYYDIETEDGRASVYPYDAITHFVMNGAGFCMAIAIANQDVELFAVGVHEERAYWVPLYGVKREEFRHSKKCAESNHENDIEAA